MICGIDEAGRGPVMGPLVVAGLWVDKATEDLLIQWGVKDSKKHSPQRREFLSAKIRQVGFSHEIVVPAHDIDSLRETMTLNDLELHIFVSIAQKKMAQTYILDSVDVDSERFQTNFQSNLGWKTHVVAQHRADALYPVVSGASILAKTCRDAEIRRIAGELERSLGIPLGSGYPSDPITIKFLVTWLQEFGELPPHTRHSWKTAKKLKETYL